MSSLRSRTIRLAKDNAKLRPRLLEILAAEDDGEDEEDKAARFTKGPEGKKEFDAWIKKQPAEVQEEWDANKDKYKDKFKSAAMGLYMTVVEKRAGGGCDSKDLPDAFKENCEKKQKEKGKGDDGDAKDDKKDDGKMPAELLEKFKGKKKAGGTDESALRRAAIRLAHENPKLRPRLLEILAKAPAKLKGKKLDKEINRLFRIHGDRVEFDIFDLGKLSNDVKKAYEAGEDMEAAMKKAVAKYRKN
jgi:hypothetical protein